MNRRIYKQNKGHAVAEIALHQDGISGEVGVSLNASDALTMGCTFGTMLKSKDQCLVVVGMDNRATSYVLETEMCRGLAATGCYVMRAGVAPSPAVQLSAHYLMASTVMITGGSKHHDENGFDFTVDQLPLHGSRLQKLAALAANGSWRKDRGGALEGNIIEMYVQKLQQLLQTNRPFKIAWDLCGGAACTVIAEISDKIPGEHLTMNDTLDAQFGLTLPDSLDSDRIEALREVILEENCDLGFIINADCSQIAVVDGNGLLWEPYRLFALFCQHTLGIDKEARIVVGMDCPPAIKVCVENHDGTLTHTPTGLGNVLEHMTHINASLGFGGNGYFAFAKHYTDFPYYDGIFTAITLLNILCKKGENLAALHHYFEDHHELPQRSFSHKDPDSVILAVRKRLIMNQISFNDADGVRTEHKRGFWWLHIDETHDDRQLVLNISAANHEQLQKLRTEFQEYLTLVTSETEQPEEILPPKAPVGNTLKNPRGKSESILQKISEDDREVIDFASRHWSSIRKARVKTDTDEEPKKPKRPWKKK